MCGTYTVLGFLYFRIYQGNVLLIWEKNKTFSYQETNSYYTVGVVGVMFCGISITVIGSFFYYITENNL